MCPIYEWENKMTGERKVVERKIDDRDTPPEGCDPKEWVRLFNTTAKAYAVGWGNHRKGKYNSRGD